MTNDAKRLLYKMYSEYKSRRKAGVSREDAQHFGSYEKVSALLPEDLPNDVDDYLRELDRSGYVDVFYADNRASETRLTTDAIEHIEQLPANCLKSVLDFVAKFIPW